MAWHGDTESCLVINPRRAGRPLAFISASDGLRHCGRFDARSQSDRPGESRIAVLGPPGRLDQSAVCLTIGVDAINAEPFEAWSRSAGLPQARPPCQTPGFEPVSAVSDQVSEHHRRILKISDQKLAREISRDVAQNPENCATETPQRLANSRECRAYFCEPDIAHRDGTGWLGCQDFEPENVAFHDRRLSI